MPTKKAPKRPSLPKPAATPTPAKRRAKKATGGAAKGTTKPPRNPAPVPQNGPKKPKRAAGKGKPLPSPQNATKRTAKPKKGRSAKPPKPAGGFTPPAPPVAATPVGGGSNATTPRRVRAERKWYVIACEPGTDRRLKKDIKRRKMIERLEDKIGRTVTPHVVEETILPLRGVVVAEGECREPQEAKQEALQLAWHLSGEKTGESTPKYDPEGYRTTIHPSKGKEKGKVGNGWSWKVKKMEEDKRVVTAKKLKYPGYIIINMVFDESTFHVIRKLRGVWGFLPLPVTTGWKPTLAETKALQEWQPTALDSEVAAELLIQQAAENKKAVANKTLTLKFKVGDQVKINDGAWADVDAVVRAIGGPDRDPAVTVDVSFMGRVIPVTVKHHQVSVS